MEELQNLRLEIDGLFQLTDSLVKDSITNDNIHLEHVKECGELLLMAKAWTGKLLGYLNIPSPYVNDGNRKEKSDIEPTDAVAETTQWYLNNHIEKIDYMRQAIESCNKKVVAFVVPQGSSREANIARTQVFVNLTDARLKLGFELERVRGGR